MCVNRSTIIKVDNYVITASWLDWCLQIFLVPFPGLPQLQFLVWLLAVSCGHGCSICILQAIKSWSRVRPGNEASIFIRRNTILCISYLKCINAADEPHFTASHWGHKRIIPHSTYKYTITHIQLCCGANRLPRHGSHIIHHQHPIPFDPWSIYSVPCVQHNGTTDEDGWSWSEVIAKLYTLIHQGERDEISAESGVTRIEQESMWGCSIEDQA